MCSNRVDRSWGAVGLAAGSLIVAGCSSADRGVRDDTAELRSWIINGQDCATCAWPATAQFPVGDKNCSATLIHPKVVTTAAHCSPAAGTVFSFGETKTAQVTAIFDDLKRALLPLVKAISERADRVDASVLYRPADVDRQWAFGVEVIKQIGFDFNRGRQDKSLHPFTTSFSIGDVRLTTRLDANYLPGALYSSLHECGHGLYEQGIDPRLERTALDDGASLGIHESQSRLWENLVGRGRPFLKYTFPRLRAAFPGQLDGVDEETFYRAINRVEPSLIRVEADEVTYNLHIMLRFELENEMLEGKLKPADLPEAWNARMRSYLGIAPPNDAAGVLQDVHWSNGMFGYFPTYSLGNLLSVQFFDKARQDIPDLLDQIAAGRFEDLLGWLRQNIHRHGRKYTPAELVRRVTGQGLTAANYVAYIQAKFSEIYGI